MEIRGQKVFLRDLLKKDIEDRIRWETIEIEWMEWDAPWEMEEEELFNPEEYILLMNKRLSNKQDPNRFRYGFQICINDKTRIHIGWINAYSIDENYCYTNGDGKLAIGIGIPDLDSRRKGYATEAWSLYIKYLLQNGIEDIYTQTWSGNIRVIGLMNKIGFVECARDKNFRIVREESYDGLTFKLDVKRHNQFIKNYSIV